MICKNENKVNEMCEILDDLHSCSPSTMDVVNSEEGQIRQDTKVHPIILAIDHLTVARGRSAQKLRSNEYTPVDRLIPFSKTGTQFSPSLKYVVIRAFDVAAYSHSSNLIYSYINKITECYHFCLQMIWKWFYNQSVSCDHGTLY